MDRAAAAGVSCSSRTGGRWRDGKERWWGCGEGRGGGGGGGRPPRTKVRVPRAQGVIVRSPRLQF